MPIAYFVLILCFVIGCSDSAAPPATSSSQREQAMGENHISKAQLQGMFDSITAKTKWNMDGDMLWGYFFTDESRAALEAANKKLEGQGYRFVNLHQPEEDGKPLPYFFLHVEKIETHCVDSLYKRNTELEAFARENGLDTYDGMDVGPAGSASVRD